jgi:lactoylglutathione lyase
MFRDPQVNYYVRDVDGCARFYRDLGFTETFRTPRDGTPVHVELHLGELTLGLAAVEAAREMVTRVRRDNQHPAQDHLR